MSDIFVLTMNRWGGEETHHYVVGIFSTKEKAEEIGKKEEIYRGGKYKAVVDVARLDEVKTNYEDIL